MIPERMRGLHVFSLLLMVAENSAFILHASPTRRMVYRRARSTGYPTARRFMTEFEDRRLQTFRVLKGSLPSSSLFMASESDGNVADETPEEEGITEQVSQAQGVDGEQDSETGEPTSEDDTPAGEAHDTIAKGEEEESGDEEGGEGVKGEGKEESEEEKDPMAEVKEMIKELERELTLEEARLIDTVDAASDKGQLGFLKKAAMVDNFRKSGAGDTSQYEAGAKADILKALLPTLAAFEAAEEDPKLETENEVKFNNSYQSMCRQLKDVYSTIGASNYFAVVGEVYEWFRHEKISEVHSDEIAEGCVVECLSPGLELGRNVIKKATCAVSLGPEKVGDEGASAEGEGAVGEEGGASAEGGDLKDAGAGVAADDGEAVEGLEEEARAAA